MKQYFRIDIADKKYRFVLLLSYSIIAVFSVTILIGGIFSWFRAYTRKVIYDMSMEQIQNLNTVVSNTLEMYRIQLQTAWQDPGVKEYFYTRKEGWRNEYQVGNYFSRMCVNSGIADYVSLFRGQEFQYYGPYYPGENEKSQIESMILETGNDTQQFLIDTDSGKNLCIFLTERNTVGAKPEKGIIYSLNLSAMEKQLISQENEDSIFLVFSSDGQSILKGKLNQEQRGKIWEEIGESRKPDRSREVELGGRKYLYNYLYNEKIDMLFVLVQDYQVLQSQISGILKISVLVTVVSLFGSFLLAVFFTNRLYYPLEEFFGRLRSGTGVLADRGEYGRKQAELTSEKIISQIHLMSQRCHSDEVLSFLNGDSAAEIPLVLRLSDRSEEGRLLLFWTSAHVLERTYIERIKKEMEDIFSGCKLAVFYEACAPWALFFLKEPVRVGALKTDEVFCERAGQGCAAFSGGDETEIYYAFSRILSDEKELQGAFQELQTLQKYHLLGQSGQGMRAEQYQEREKLEIPPRIYEGCLDAVKKGDAKAAEEKLSGILEILSHLEIRKVLMSLAGFCVLLEQSNWERDLDMRRRQEKYLEHYLRLASLYDRGELENYLGHLTEEACLENNVFPEKTLRMNLLDAVEYIREHYCEETISVEQVADRFHMSVSYFSKLFNEYAGMTFPEFVNDLRLSYAKELLQSNPNLNVKRIAELCGFSTTSYFSQQFKKKFGVSPSTVRNK